MGFLSRALGVLPFAAAAALPFLGAAACGAQVATVLASDGGADAQAPTGRGCTVDPDCNDDPQTSSLMGRCLGGICACNSGTVISGTGRCKAPGDGGAQDCAAKGGVCVGGESAPPPNHRPGGPGEGTCVPDDVCWLPTSTDPHVCTADYECNGVIGAAAIWGTCFHGVCICDSAHLNQADGKCYPPPWPSCSDQNGTCRQGPAACQADEIGSSFQTNMSCGDLVPAVCCNKATACVGPSVDFSCCTPNGAPNEPICVNGWRTCPSGAKAIAKPGGCP